MDNERDEQVVFLKDLLFAIRKYQPGRGSDQQPGQKTDWLCAVRIKNPKEMRGRI